jgi:hypothetical protein
MALKDHPEYEKLSRVLKSYMEPKKIVYPFVGIPDNISEEEAMELLVKKLIEVEGWDCRPETITFEQLRDALDTAMMKLDFGLPFSAPREEAEREAAKRFLKERADLLLTELGLGSIASNPDQYSPEKIRKEIEEKARAYVNSRKTELYLRGVRDLDQYLAEYIESTTHTVLLGLGKEELPEGAGMSATEWYEMKLWRTRGGWPEGPGRGKIRPR